MKIYKIAKISALSSLPDVWLDNADPFESKGVKWNLEVLPVNTIQGSGYATNFKRDEIEKVFRNGGQVPLTLVENKRDGSYELHDGQHRFAAYRNVFPKAKYIKVAVFVFIGAKESL